jgi:Ca2+-binding RTX toxin-like protein
MQERRVKRRLLAGSIGLALALVAAPGALASTVTVSGGDTIKFSEVGNEANKVTVGFDTAADVYTVLDTGPTLTPSGACTKADSHTALCPGAGIKTITVNTDDLGDTIALDPSIPSTVKANANAGGGNDTVLGHGTLDGGSGDDTVIGLSLADTIRGGSGRDSLNGGDGPDDIAGGGGTDTLVYPADRVTPISVTIGAGNGNDGGVEDQGSGGRDTVQGDVEAVIGTPQGDVLAGDSSSETLIGAAGNDTLVGNNGNDTLLGYEGDDLMVGGDGHDLLVGWLGNDQLFGGRNNDRLTGGPDNDLVVGNFGADVLKGKSGIDLLRARDGTRDVKIKCGPGPNKREGATRDKHLDPRARSC